MTNAEARLILEVVVNLPSDLDLEILTLKLADRLPTVNWKCLLEEIWREEAYSESSERI
jgi:hypothetical protein